MKAPSASNAEAFVRCTASHVLPQVESYEAKTERGTDGHNLLAGVVNRKPGAGPAIEAAFPGIGRKLAPLLAGAIGSEAEAAFVVDVKRRQSVYIGKDIDRQYEKALGRKLGPHEIGTSLDFRCMTEGGVPMIRDWKFGVYSSWWQLHIQAMGVLWQDGVKATEVDAGFVHIEQRGDGEEVFVTEDSAILYGMDLDDRADELMKAFGYAKRLEDEYLACGPSSLKTVQGSWCQYCGAFPHCPSKWALAKSMMGLDVVGHVGALTLEQCGSAWKKLAEIEKNIVKKTKDALKERMATEGGFPLDNGKHLRVITMPGRDSLDRPALQSLLRKYDIPKAEIDGIFKTGEPFTTVLETSK